MECEERPRRHKRVPRLGRIEQGAAQEHHARLAAQQVPHATPWLTALRFLLDQARIAEVPKEALAAGKERQA